MLRRFTLLGLLAVSPLSAESGLDAWLRYAPLDQAAARQYRETLPALVVALNSGPLVDSAQAELIRGVRGMVGRTLRIESRLRAEPALILGTPRAFRESLPELALSVDVADDGYWLKTITFRGVRHIIIAAPNDRGVLYGAFAFLRRIGLSQSIADIDEKQSPYAAIRWVNQWDNLDGSIERGYGGRSIFWEGGRARDDLSRVSDYGRLLASVGINACSVNNVNADSRVLASDFVPQVARIADALRPWGVRVALAVDFGSPQTVGGLATFDPLDAAVSKWWADKARELYQAIPDFGGFVLKADSEGRVGPSTYGRTHADAANVVARALAPHGGLLFYRGFVYDHHMDWRNPKNDRARAAYDNFHPLDGQFDNNVVVQIKNGPIDFQVREPASPLFAGLSKTNQAVELQITQEYMGQARHLVFLPPMWKETLDFEMGPGPVKAFVSGKLTHRAMGGFVGVANAGLDENWFSNDLSQANLYGFGRLAWNPDLSAKLIAEEWTRLTFGNHPEVVSAIAAMQLASWRAYENYTGPLGLQTLADITGNHYGVNVEASEGNGWGQWHRADSQGVGMDRTVATGTGFVSQYPPAAARLFESLATCTDDFLLFFHHVPYTYRLHSGETVIQYIYDSHYQGAAAAADFVKQWKTLRGRLDERRYGEVLAQLEYQAGQAQVWRDAVTNWFRRASGIPDAKDRVGRYPGRVEAESMDLEGYVSTDVTPWEAASGGRAVACSVARCAAQFSYSGPPGWYDVRIQFFDQNNGVSRFKLLIGDQAVDEWVAAANLPTGKIDGSSSTRHTVAAIALRPGDRIRIEATPDGAERAPFDYVEILPASN
jgi:alpha-glucuronidase